MKSIRLDFFRYASLNMLATVGTSIYILADTFFISKAEGSLGLAALNFSIVIYTLMQGVGIMIGVGGAIDYSLNKSKKDARSDFVNKILMSGLVFSAIFLSIALFFSEGISKFLGADSQTLGLTMLYLETLLSFSPFFIFNQIFLAFARNDDSPKLAMIAMMLSSIANVILDYIFMFPMKMGMFGAAFATGLSPIISILILSRHFSRFGGLSESIKNFKARIKIRDNIRVLALGLPSFISEFTSSITLFVFNIVILKISGNVGVAAYGVIANVAIIATALFSGLSQGIQPLISKSYAEDNKISLNTVLKYGFISSVVLAVLINFTTLVFSSGIVDIFNGQNNPILAKIAEMGVKMYFIGYFFAGINILMISYFSATSRTKNAMFISILRSSVILIPSVLIMSELLGILGVWSSFLFTEFVVCMITYSFYKKLKKQKN